MAWGNQEMDWALAKPRLQPPNELPLTLEKVKEMRNWSVLICADFEILRYVEFVQKYFNGIQWP
jgi:hypothetical protein